MIVVHVRNSVIRLCGILPKIIFCVSVKQYVPILKFGAGLMYCHTCSLVQVPLLAVSSIGTQTSH